MNATQGIDISKFRARVVNVQVHAFDVYCGRGGLGYGDGYFGNYSLVPGEASDARVRIARVKDFLVGFRHRMGLVYSERWRGTKAAHGLPIEFGELEYSNRVNE